MDIQINCENVNVSRAYGNKISVTLENIEVGDIVGEKDILESIDMENYIDTVEPVNILDFMGDDEIIKYLTNKGYSIL